MNDTRTYDYVIVVGTRVVHFFHQRYVNVAAQWEKVARGRT